jgi:hypothetical protein
VNYCGKKFYEMVANLQQNSFSPEGFIGSVVILQNFFLRH